MKATGQNLNEEMKEIKPKSGFMTSLLALIAILITIIGGIWILNMIGGAG